jgi:hypothetical protein
MIPVLRICVLCFLVQNWNHDPEFYGILLNFSKFYEFYGPTTVLLRMTVQLACSLVDKCNKDQLKKYPPEDGLI